MIKHFIFFLEHKIKKKTHAYEFYFSTVSKIFFGVSLTIFLGFLPFLPTIIPIIIFFTTLIFLGIWGKKSFDSPYWLIVLIFFSIMLRLVFFTGEYELGETFVEYIYRVQFNQLPVIEHPEISPIINIQPFSYLLFHYLGMTGMDLLLVPKFLRILLGTLNTLLVYAIAVRCLENKKIALLSAILFTSNFIELWYMGGDQFKNFLGETFFLAFLLIFTSFVNFDSKLNLSRFLFLFLFALSAALSHRVYMLLIPIFLSLYFLNGFLKSKFSKKNVVTIPMFISASALAILIFLTNYVSPFLGFMKFLNVPKFSEVSPPEWVAMGAFQKLLLPGQIFHTSIWLLITFGALVLYRNQLKKNNGLFFLFSAYQFLFIISRSFFFGTNIDHGRFIILTTPFVSILGALLISKLLTSLGKESKTTQGFFYLVIMINLISLSLTIINIQEQAGNAIYLALSNNTTMLIGRLFGELSFSEVLMGFIYFSLGTLLVFLFGIPGSRITKKEMMKIGAEFSNIETLIISPVIGIAVLCFGGTLSLVLVNLKILPREDALILGILFAICISIFSFTILLSYGKRVRHAKS